MWSLRNFGGTVSGGGLVNLGTSAFAHDRDVNAARHILAEKRYEEENMIELKIEGMTCMHCVKAVSEALLAVPGVAAVREVSLERGTAILEGSPKPQALIDAVREAGYRAEVRE